MLARPSVLLLAALLLTACAASEGTSSDGSGEASTSAATETPSDTESVAVTSPTPRASSSAGKPPTKAEQARLDERLRDAAWADDVGRARSLIERGADVNAQDETQQSAYLIATSEGYLQLLRLCLANGAEVDDLDSWNGTGLIRAAERGHYRVVGELLQAGIDKDHVNRIGFQAIHESVWLGEDTQTYADTVRVLVAGGVELDRPSVNQDLTPLQMADRLGFTMSGDVLRHALDRPAPADPDAALLAAARRDDGNAAAAALRAGADPAAADDNGDTVADLASEGGDVARLLTALGLG